MPIFDPAIFDPAVFDAATVAGVATGTGAAGNASSSVAPTAGVASGTGAAFAATAVTPTLAAAATGTGASYNASLSLAIPAGVATGTGAALGATVSGSPFVSATAGLASGTGAAFDVVPDTGAVDTFAGRLRLYVSNQDFSTGLQWQTFSITESIGQPDTLSAELVEINDTIRTYLQPLQSYIFVKALLDDDVLFSGVAHGISRNAKKGVRIYSLRAVGWDFLLPKRLVGVPAGVDFEVQQDDDPERLPTAVAVDLNAQGDPTAAMVQALFDNYWNFPSIDTSTYVADAGGSFGDDLIKWSGSDMEGALNDMAAAGSAAALWWFAHDSALAGSPSAPHLALHFGVIVMPTEEEIEEPDSLLLGFPTADTPTIIAPYAISDVPIDGVAILPEEIEIQTDVGQMLDAVYVRGATGYTIEVTAAPIGFPLPYQLGAILAGGTGWVGEPGGLFGEAYVDAPAAIDISKRGQFGNAYIGSHNAPRINAVIRLAGYDGWHKGQAVKVTDADWEFEARWLLIRSVSLVMKDPGAEAIEYTITAGDTLGPGVGFDLRQQRLREQRKPVRPATRFIPYVGDLNLASGETAPVTMQLADDAGEAKPVGGVGAVWHLLLNGVDLEDPEDVSKAFYLSGLVEVTDDFGQVTATLNVGPGATSADAARPWAGMVL